MNLSATILRSISVRFLALIAVLSVVSTPAIGELNVSDKAGTVSFSGKHAGMTFNGEFEKWTARLNLPTGDEELASPSISASFDLSSAETGDSLYNETLVEGDWFDAENHPTGTFESDTIVKSASGYEVSGTLTMRGKTLPVTFILKEENGRLLAQFNIDRLAYGIGLDSDPEAEWVSQFINLQLDIPSSY